MQLRWGFWDHNHCPCCHQPDEMTTHLFLCRHSGMTLTWETGIDIISDWLRGGNTPRNRGLSGKHSGGKDADGIFCSK